MTPPDPSLSFECVVHHCGPMAREDSVSDYYVDDDRSMSTDRYLAGKAPAYPKRTICDILVRIPARHARPLDP